jgi:hypothetical protein
MHAVLVRADNQLAPCSILLLSEDVLEALPMHTTNTLLLPVVDYVDHTSDVLEDTPKIQKHRFTVSRVGNKILFEEQAVMYPQLKGVLEL